MDNTEPMAASGEMETAQQVVSNTPTKATPSKPRKRKVAAEPKRSAGSYPLGIRVIDN